MSSDNCDGCEHAHNKINHLEDRVSNLETFKKWAEPILNDIRIIKNDSRWMILIALVFVAITSYVYVYQIYPSFEKQNDDKVEIIKEVQKLRIEMMKELQESQKKINENTTKASKINYRGLKKVIEKE